MVLPVNPEQVISKPYMYESKIQLPTERAAAIVAAAIDVDPELRPTEVTRRIRVEGPILFFNMSADNPKLLRNSVVSLYDFIRVSLSAIAEFSSD